MTYDAQRLAIHRTKQELWVVGVRECANHYASEIDQLCNATDDLSNASYWFPTSVSISTDDAIAPDGTQTADTVTFNATNDAIGNVTPESPVTSKAYSAGVWLRAPNGPETVTLRIFNTTGTVETASLQLTITTTWQRFFLHQLFTGAATGQLTIDLIRTASDDITELEVWRMNAYRNPSDLDRVIKFPSVAQVTTTVKVSRCAIADAGDGNRCFFSRPTCQDPTNFNAGNEYETNEPHLKGIREYRFCNRAGPLPLPGEIVFPFVINAESASQEIDPERAITVNERFTVEMEDDADPGAWNPRQEKEGSLVNTARGNGTFWRRWREIYANYPNPEGYAIRKVGFIEAGVTEADFQKRGTFLIRNFKTTDTTARLVLGDALKLARVTLPGKISDDNTLGAAISAAATTIPIRKITEITEPAANAAGANPDYIVTLELDPEGTPEKVNVTARDLDAGTITVQRGRWGTTASTHPNRTAFREVYEFGTERDTPSQTPLGKNPVDIMIELAHYIGLEDDQIETADLESQRDDWLPSVVNTGGPLSDLGSGTLFRRTQTETVKVEDLFTSLRKASLFFLWMNEDQKFAGAAYAPKRPSDSSITLTDAANFLAGSIETDDNDESRISRCLIAWTKDNDDVVGDIPEDYRFVLVEIEGGHEQREFYGDERTLIILSEWLQNNDLAVAEYLAAHYRMRFKNGARRFAADVEIKDDSVKLGAFVKLDTAHLQDAHGNNRANFAQVIKKRPVSDSRIRLELLDTGIHDKIGFYAGASVNQWSNASQTEKEENAFYTDEDGFVTAGVPGDRYW